MKAATRDITRRLRRLRLERGYSQDDVVLRARMSKGRYVAIELAYRAPDADDLRVLARVLRCHPTDIVPASPSATPEPEAVSR